MRQDDHRPVGVALRLGGLAGRLFIHLLFTTCRIREAGHAKVREILASRRFIFAFWHARILLVSHLYRGWGGAIMVSGSPDGEIIAQILRRQGHRPVRGSTTRGGARAMAHMIREVKKVRAPAVIVPDGPQGPRYRVQPGVITLAEKTGYPIVPMTYGAGRRKVFGSWDRFVLPYPFSECTMVYGEPVRVPAGADRQARESLRRELEDELNRITRLADGLYGQSVP